MIFCHCAPLRQRAFTFLFSFINERPKIKSSTNRTPSAIYIETFGLFVCFLRTLFCLMINDQVFHSYKMLQASLAQVSKDALEYS